MCSINACRLSTCSVIMLVFFYCSCVTINTVITQLTQLTVPGSQKLVQTQVSSLQNTECSETRNEVK